jgi:hypothetical protein
MEMRGHLLQFSQDRKQADKHRLFTKLNAVLLLILTRLRGSATFVLPRGVGTLTHVLEEPPRCHQTLRRSSL